MYNHKFKIINIYFLHILVLLTLFSIPSFAETPEQKKELQEKVRTYLGIENLDREQSGGFVYQLTLRNMYNQLSPALQKVANSYISAGVPTRQKTIQSALGRFTLHYDTSGVHAVPLADISGNGIPDLIDSAAVIFDHVWQVEIDQLGFQAPKDILGNVVQTYHIVFSSLGSRDYGFTNFEMEVSSAKGTYYTSFIEMDNDFQNSGLATKGLDGLRVTAAHEFNHAIQLGYPAWTEIDPLDERYFLEMLATWLEEFVYEEINDYHQYLASMFRSIQAKSFTSQSLMYGNSLYFIMLEEQHNPQINIKVLETIGKKNVKALDAMDIVLKKEGSSFSESLNDYGKWMYFTGDRTIPGEFFNDAAEFPQITVSIAFNDNIIIENEASVQSESFYYILVNSTQQAGGFTSVSTDDNNSQVRLNHFNTNYFFSSSVAAGVNQPVFLDFVPQDMTFLVSNSRDYDAKINFIFTPDSTIKLPDVLKVIFGPNPAIVEKGTSYFYSVPAESKITILDLNQHPVRTLQSVGPDNVPVPWDLRDDNGKPLNSGIYYYIVISSSKEQVGKIAVIR